MSFPAAVVGILRGVDPGFFPAAMEAAFEAGLEALEVTMNTDGAEEIIGRSRPSVPRGRLLGMGTVRSVDEAERAVAAGAMFLVTPNTDRLVIEYARSRDVPVIAGALTPTEVQAAWSAGASLVKVFPCGALPRYLAALKGPFDRVPLMPVGGAISRTSRSTSGPGRPRWGRRRSLRPGCAGGERCGKIGTKRPSLRRALPTAVGRGRARHHAQQGRRKCSDRKSRLLTAPSGTAG